MAYAHPDLEFLQNRKGQIERGEIRIKSKDAKVAFELMTQISGLPTLLLQWKGVPAPDWPVTLHRAYILSFAALLYAPVMATGPQVIRESISLVHGACESAGGWLDFLEGGDVPEDEEFLLRNFPHARRQAFHTEWLIWTTQDVLATITNKGRGGW